MKTVSEHILYTLFSKTFRTIHSATPPSEQILLHHLLLQPSYHSKKAFVFLVIVLYFLTVVQYKVKVCMFTLWDGCELMVPLTEVTLIYNIRDENMSNYWGDSCCCFSPPCSVPHLLFHYAFGVEGTISEYTQTSQNQTGLM